MTLVSALHRQFTWSTNFVSMTTHLLPHPQLYAIPAVRMEGHVLPPTTVPAPQGGLETHAHKVGSCDSVRVWGVHRTGYFLLSAVVCSPPCQNGGSCVSPHHCVCTHGWTGTGCNRRKFNKLSKCTGDTDLYCCASVFSYVWFAEVCASGAQPSCPPAGLRHGPPTCGVCRQISEHSYCEDLVQVVANLSGLEPFTSLGIDSAFFEPQGFLHVLAFVETRDGLLLSDCDKGGIWNVNYIQLFNCLSQSSLLSYPYHTEYKFTVSLVDSFTYEDFNCPASSAFAALLLLICNSSPNDPVAAAANLPTERDSFPSFYARYYCHPNCNESGAEMKFQEGMQAFEGCTRKKRHLTSPYTSTGSELSWNADTVETAEDSRFAVTGLQHSAGVYSFG